MNQKPLKTILCFVFVFVLVLRTAVSPAQQSAKGKLVQAVDAVGMTVSNMERSIDFFSKVLSLLKEARKKQEACARSYCEAQEKILKAAQG